jgi:hypothetical protein
VLSEGGRTVATLDEYFAARDQRDAARRGLNAIADQLDRLANILRDPRGVRLNKMTAYKGPPPDHIIVDRDELVPWDRLEPAIEAYTRGDDAFRRIESNLTPEQRRQISR